MTLADIPARTFSSTRQQHLDDHTRLTAHLKQSVYSGDYSTLQESADDAAALGRPLVIEPKTHTVTTPLVINGASDLHVFAYRAKFAASGNLASLVEFKNCTRCSLHGGWLSIPDGATVTNALYAYHDTASSTRNAFYDLTIEGHYGVGVRVGKLTDTAQCDHHYFDNIELIGRSDAGQIGVYVGTDSYGNCLNHAFNNMMISGNEKHVVVSATNAYMSNVFFDTADVDLDIRTTSFSIQNVRSEDSKRFMDDGGVVSAGANISVRDVLWNAQQIHSDGNWIKSNIAGVLTLDNVRVVNAAVRPVISCQPSKPKVVHVRGLQEGGGSVACPFAGAYSVNENVIVKTDSYIELDSSGIPSNVS